MIDRQGRNIDYIRISVTDRCNLRCRYCMPAEGVQQVSHSEILTFDEILRLAGIFSRAGIRHIKITGGEPLVRRGITGLIKDLKKVPGIETVTMTTNGILLAESLPALAEAGVDGINISLDTLQQDKYRLLTGTDGLHTVLDAIDAAGDYPQIKFKINTVTLADVNRSEVSAIAAIAATKSIDVRFIEMMPMGPGRDMAGYGQDEILDELTRTFGQPETAGSGTGPAAYYKFSDFKGRIGFISPISHKFCGDCNRVRLTAQGFLRTCLQYEEGADIRALLRSGADDETILLAIEKAIYNKPEGHSFGMDEDTAVSQIMSRIGG